MIESGVKTEEYREIKPYYEKRLMYVSDTNEFGGVEHEFNDFDYVCFHKGYTANTMTFEIDNISVGKGNPNWGAPPNKEVFIIKLGALIASNPKIPLTT